MALRSLPGKLKAFVLRASGLGNVPSKPPPVTCPRCQVKTTTLVELEEMVRRERKKQIIARAAAVGSTAGFVWLIFRASQTIVEEDIQMLQEELVKLIKKDN